MSIKTAQVWVARTNGMAGMIENAKPRESATSSGIQAFARE